MTPDSRIIIENERDAEQWAALRATPDQIEKWLAQLGNRRPYVSSIYKWLKIPLPVFPENRPVKMPKKIFAEKLAEARATLSGGGKIN
ncbi:MAG: hypothetical protein LBU53_02130 [Zoogloeaceae bacterium]|jgi:hypothetical protein|nr:hypothetical protein [Zoogloeaceae bacterium]